MEFEESEDYKNFTYSFLDTIDISRCVRICRGPLETMNYIENLYSEDYKKFCIEHENNNTLPSIVKFEDDSFDYMFNIMDIDDFSGYVKDKLGITTFEVKEVLWQK